MRTPLILRETFLAGPKNHQDDVTNITEALQATGFLPRPASGGPASGGPAPSEAEVGAGLRAFQDRVGLVVDGRASPRGPTESELSRAVDRAAVLAARPPRTGPIRFGTLMANNYRESRSMAQGVRRRRHHRGAVEFMRRAMEDDPGGSFPEIVQFPEQVDVLDSKHGRASAPIW